MTVTTYLKLFRVPLVFIAIAESAAGYLCVLQGVTPNLLALALLAVASAGLQCFGSAMNDVADRERDKERHPDRVIPSGKLVPQRAIRAAALMLAASVAALLVLPGGGLLPRVAVWAALALLIPAYDFFLKISPVMGLLHALNFLLGVAASPPTQRIGDLAGPSESLHFALMTFVYATSLTLLWKWDEKKINTSLVFFFTAVLAVATAWPVLLGPSLSGSSSPMRWGIAAVLVAWLFTRAGKAKERQSVMRLVRDGAAGMILLDSVFVLASGSHDEGLILAGLVLPAVAGLAVFKSLD